MVTRFSMNRPLSVLPHACVKPRQFRFYPLPEVDLCFRLRDRTGRSGVVVDRLPVERTSTGSGNRWTRGARAPVRTQLLPLSGRLGKRSDLMLSP